MQLFLEHHRLTKRTVKVCFCVAYASQFMRYVPRAFRSGMFLNAPSAVNVFLVGIGELLFGVRFWVENFERLRKYCWVAMCRR